MTITCATCQGGSTHRIVKVSKRRAQHVKGRFSITKGRQRQLSGRRLRLLLLLLLLQLRQSHAMMLLILQRLLLLVLLLLQLVLLLLQNWHAPHVLLHLRLLL